MSPKFVLDCSVTMAWFFESEVTPATDSLLDQLNQGGQAVVTMHWLLEVANTLLMGERRKRILPTDSIQFLGVLDSLDIEMDSRTAAHAGTSTLALARIHNLTAYDAAYLELALRHNLPLATLDKDLRVAAKKAGIKVLP